MRGHFCWLPSPLSFSASPLAAQTTPPNKKRSPPPHKTRRVARKRHMIRWWSRRCGPAWRWGGCLPRCRQRIVLRRWLTPAPRRCVPRVERRWCGWPSPANPTTIRPNRSRPKRSRCVRRVIAQTSPQARRLPRCVPPLRRPQIRSGSPKMRRSWRSLRLRCALITRRRPKALRFCRGCCSR